MNKTALLLILCTALFAQQKGTLTDTRDGKTYKTVKIGEQVWMAENLNFAAKGSRCYGENGRTDNRKISEYVNLSKAEAQANCVKYGRLYDWKTAMKVCPKGWNLPSREEWDILFRYADTTSYTDDDPDNFYNNKIVGKFLKAESGWVRYDDELCNGEDKYGFSAMPGGEGSSGSCGDYFHDVGYYGHWWSSSEYYPSLYISYDYLNYDYNDVVSGNCIPEKDLYSVRCLQTNTQQKTTPPACPPPVNAQQKGTFTDTRDGKVYKTTKIGEQVWMAENLNYEADSSKCFGEGGKVYNPKTKKDETLSNAEIQARCKKYGRMYNWETALKVCPDGWHLPNNAEWDKLYRYADCTNGTERPYRSKTAGKFLKATSGWNREDGKSGNGEDKYGFSALPAGLGNSSGSFSDFDGFWWSSSEFAYYRRISQHEDAGWDNGGQYQSLSVRCVQNAPAPPEGDAK